MYISTIFCIFAEKKQEIMLGKLPENNRELFCTRVDFINLEDIENVEKYRNYYNLPSLSIYKEALEKRYLNDSQ